MHDLDIQLTPLARQALALRSAPLVVELELLFSCLVRKRVKFPSQPPAGGHALPGTVPGLLVHFRPIVTHHCRLEDIVGGQATDDLPLAKPAAFTPHWLRLDYRDGTWSGEFGYARDS